MLLAGGGFAAGCASYTVAHSSLAHTTPYRSADHINP